MEIRIKAQDSPCESAESTRNTSQLREKIANAISIQRKRQGKKNVKLNPQEIIKWCICDKEAKKMLDNASVDYDFSPRAVSSCLKVARTIADMECKEIIDVSSIKEAISLRKKGTGINSGIEFI